jgi:regulator of replication initiation timing
VFCFTLIITLLCIAGVERNPGPGDELSLQEVQDTLAKLIKDSKSETLGAVNDLAIKVNSLGTQISGLQTEINLANNKIEHLESENKVLSDRIEFVESTVRKKNMLIFGVAQENNDEDICDIVVNLFKDKLGVSVLNEDIEVCYRLGKVDNNKRPVFVTFVNMIKKNVVMKNLFKLKGGNISVSEDLTPKARAIRKTVLKCAKDARSQGFNVKVKAKSLFINNKEYGFSVLERPDWLLSVTKKKETEDEKTRADSERRKRSLSTSPVQGERGSEEPRVVVKNGPGGSRLPTESGNGKMPPPQGAGDAKKQKRSSSKTRSQSQSSST